MTAAVALGLGALCATGIASVAGATADPAGSSYLSGLHAPTQLAPTVPSNGDVNPYGVAPITASHGRLVKGATLVSNFNDRANVQGTGTTIVQVLPHGTLALFANVASAARRCPGGIGLTTALAVLPGGWVVVGSIGSVNGGALPPQNPAGCLVVLDDTGHVAAVWSGREFNGPWDMAATSTATSATLYVADVLERPATSSGPLRHGTGEVVRVDVALHGRSVPTLTSTTVIGTGFSTRADHSTFVLGPTGIAVGADGTAYVAQTLGNHVTAIPNAATRTSPIKDGTSTLATGGDLNSPLGAAIAPNGDLLIANGGNGDIVELSPAGHQVAHRQFVADGAGALFGLAVTSQGSLVFVNDATNALDVAVEP